MFRIIDEYYLQDSNCTYVRASYYPPRPIEYNVDSCFKRVDALAHEAKNDMRHQAGLFLKQHVHNNVVGQ